MIKAHLSKGTVIRSHNLMFSHALYPSHNIINIPPTILGTCKFTFSCHGKLAYSHFCQMELLDIKYGKHYLVQLRKK